MARSRLFTYLSLGVLSTVELLSPHVSHAAGIADVFNPIIDQSGACVCAGMAPSWGCILQTIQNVTNVGISVGVVICVLYLAYAGATFMMSSANPGMREQGKMRIMNAVVGMVVILTAWLVVDFVMKTLYNPSVAFSGDNFGPWNNILGSNGDDFCIQPHNPTALTTGALSIIAGKPLNPSTGGTLNSSGNGACSAATVQAAAVQGGYPMSTYEANTLSCVAQYESGCGTVMKNYNWNGVKDPNKPSTAYGAFQVTLSGNAACYNNPTCQKAAGVSGSLDCSKGFSKGKPIPGSAIEQQCEKAAANLGCNAVAAACVLQKQGISAWTADSHSTGQGSCG